MNPLLPPTPELISFRALVPEITETTYLTHAIYYYPAKFIPQVVRYCINTYTAPNDWIIDPFAGSATVGLESLLCHRNAILLDLNFMLNHIVPLKMSIRQTDLSETVLLRELDSVTQSREPFHPDWRNLAYWYAPEVLERLSCYWGGQKKMAPGPYAWIVEAALIKVSKNFSYAEHKMPKLFQSKRKIADITARIQNDWRAQLDKALYSTARDILNRVQQLAPILAEREQRVIALGGVDSAKLRLDDSHRADCLLTSPPYLQAQEYIRTSKLDLYWLGHAESEIKESSKLEIPYRKADTLIETETLNQLRALTARADLTQLLDSYFCYTIQALENAMHTLRPNGNACIFVGNPKIDGVEVETWRILAEYFTDRGFRLEHLWEDRIQKRQLFGQRKNKNPEGMKSEYLLVLSKVGAHP